MIDRVGTMFGQDRLQGFRVADVTGQGCFAGVRFRGFGARQIELDDLLSTREKSVCHQPAKISVAACDEGPFRLFAHFCIHPTCGRLGTPDNR